MRIWKTEGGWRHSIVDRIAVIGPLLISTGILAIATTRWMQGVRATGILAGQVVEMDRELGQLGRDRDNWEADEPAHAFPALWRSLPEGEAGMRELLAWFKGTAARHGVALAVRVGSSELVGSGEWRIERLRLSLILTAPGGRSGVTRLGATRACSDVVAELVASGAPIQVLAASWEGQGQGLSQCELSTWIWVRSPG